MKRNISGLTTIVLFAILFASCNTSNKIVSSFGKRKYTRGYYFNFISHNRPELPVVAAKKVVRASTPNIVQESHALINNKVSAVTTFINQVKQNKITPLQISPLTTNKVSYMLPKNNPVYSQNRTDYGTPGHQGIVNMGVTKYDRFATIGLVLAILGIFTAGLLAIPGIIFSIMGLKSVNRHTQAVVGLVIGAIITAFVVLGLVLSLVIF